MRLALSGEASQILRLLLAQSSMIVGAGFRGWCRALIRTPRGCQTTGPRASSSFFMRQAVVDGTGISIGIPVLPSSRSLSGALPALSTEDLTGPCASLVDRSASHSAGALWLQRAMWLCCRHRCQVVVLASARCGPPASAIWRRYRMASTRRTGLLRGCDARRAVRDSRRTSRVCGRALRLWTVNLR